MSNKNFLRYTLLFSLIILISTKEEDIHKNFLSFGSNETDDGTDIDNGIHSDNGTDSEDGSGKDVGSGTRFIHVKCLYSKGYNIYSSTFTK